MTPTKTDAPAKRGATPSPRGVRGARDERAWFGIAAVVVVVGLAVGLAIALSSNSTTPKRHSGSGQTIAQDRQQIANSLATTRQIFNSFMQQNASCTTALCVANAGFNSLSAEGTAANDVHQSYFPLAAEGSAQAYVNTLIALQDVYKYIGEGSTMSVVRSYLPALRKDMTNAVTAANKADGLL